MLKWLKAQYDKVLHVLHVASGKKLLTVAGGAIGLVGEFCKTLGDDWIVLHAHWLDPYCTWAALIGLAMALLGKGVFDRRVDAVRGAENVGGLEQS